MAQTTERSIGSPIMLEKTSEEVLATLFPIAVVESVMQITRVSGVDIDSMFAADEPCVKSIGRLTVS